MDLGEIAQPLIVCGGAYSNLEALQALFAAARERGIPPERIIHTGDVVAYCADAEATATLLRDSGAPAIKGNVEESLAARRGDCDCGFEVESACNALSERWFAHADAQVGAALRDWMADLPDQLVFTMSGRRVRVVHGGVRVINAFIFTSSPEHVFAIELADAQADVVLAGHCGIPFTRRFGERLWHNTGSIGMPANDGTPRVWFSVLTPEPEGIQFEHVPLAYDHTAARAKMIAADLPRGYADALDSGLWPSASVLPEKEEAETGRPLDPASTLLAAPVLQNGRVGPSEAMNKVAPMNSSRTEPRSAAPR